MCKTAGTALQGVRSSALRKTGSIHGQIQLADATLAAGWPTASLQRQVKLIQPTIVAATALSHKR